MKLGRVEVSNGFLILWAWLLYLDTDNVVPQLVLACLLHELGHILALYYFRQPIRHIKLTVFGAQIVFENTLSYCQELVTALAGPGVNLLLCYLFRTVPGSSIFSGINLVLALFNLLPVGHLDGRRCLNSLLYFLLPVSCADRTSMCICGLFTAVILILGMGLALCGTNCTLLLMCIWILKGYENEKYSKDGEKRGNRTCQTVQKQVK